jgi:hypothetical protein
MQRREAKIGLRDRKCHRRPQKRNDTGENPHKNGLSGVGVRIWGLGGLDGGDDLNAFTASRASPPLAAIVPLKQSACLKRQKLQSITYIGSFLIFVPVRFADSKQAVPTIAVGNCRL